MCNSRGIKVIAMLAFMGLLAFGLSAESDAQTKFGQELRTLQSQTFQNQWSVGDDACKLILTPGRNGDKGC